MLDRLYRLFDELTGKYGLFKVETIGDAYMTVGNLRTPQQDHAALVARFAIEAVQAANSVMIRSDDSTSGFLSIRAGTRLKLPAATFDALGAASKTTTPEAFMMYDTRCRACRNSLRTCGCFGGGQHEPPVLPLWRHRQRGVPHGEQQLAKSNTDVEGDGAAASQAGA